MYNERIQRKETGGQGCLKYMLALGLQRPALREERAPIPVRFLPSGYILQEEKHRGTVSMASAGREWAARPILCTAWGV